MAELWNILMVVDGFDYIIAKNITSADVILFEFSNLNVDYNFIITPGTSNSHDVACELFL
jgi:hypothetical protein